MKIAKYKEEDMNKILNILDSLEIKGLKKMSLVLEAVQILQSPISVEEEKETKEGK